MSGGLMPGPMLLRQTRKTRASFIGRAEARNEMIIQSIADMAGGP